MARQVSDRGLVVAAVALLLALGLAFIGLIAVSDLHKSKCPPEAARASPASPEGVACLQLREVQGSRY